MNINKMTNWYGNQKPNHGTRAVCTILPQSFINDLRDEYSIQAPFIGGGSSN